MSSVSNVNNTNEYYYLSETGENVGEIEENVSIYTDMLEEVSNSDFIQTNTENLTAEEYVSTLDDTTKEALIETLENIVTAEEEALNETKDNNGVIASAWDWIKNKTGIGQGSDKVQTEIDELKTEIEELKSDPSKLAEVYEKVTGNELTSEELTSLVNGEADFSDSKVVNSVSKYQQGQKQVVNTISSITSGLTMVGLVTAGLVAAPFTAGASLAGTVGLIAAGTAAYMVPQVVDGVTEADGYSASEIAQDVATGVINSAVTAASLGAGKAVGSALTETVTSNAATIATTLGTTTETAAQIGTKAAGLAAAETTSVLMSDGIAVGDYLVEAALNEDVDFSLETLGTTAASATAAGLAAGTVAFGTSSVIRPVLTSGTTASSQVAGRLVSSGISGAAAGASATAAAGSTSYLISCSVNGEEVDFDEWLDSTTENMAAGALTGFAAGVGFEAVQVAVGTPAPSGTASRQTGTTEDGLKYTEYLDKDGNVIARDVKVSDIKSYNSNSTELAQANSNNSSTEISTDTVSDSSANSSARTVRFTYNSSNVINENGTVANEYATVNDVQVYDWADNITFAQKIQSANSNVYDEYVEEPVNYLTESDVIIEQIGNETVVSENGNVTNNSASVVQNSSGGQEVIIDSDTGVIVSDVNPAQEITVVSDGVNPFELQTSGNLSQITTVENSSALTTASSETSAASSSQSSSIAAVNAASNYKPAIVTNTQNSVSAQNTNPYENLFFETLDDTQIQGQLAFTEVQSPQEELITNEPMQNLPADSQFEGQLSIEDKYFENFEQEYIIQNSSTELQAVQLTENVNKTTQNVSDNSQLTVTEIQETPQLTKKDVENLEEYKNGEAYEYINRSLREEKNIGGYEVQEIANSIDKAFEIDGTALEEDTVLYRGVRRNYSWSKDEFTSPFDNLKVGDEISDLAYTSTSTNKKVATAPDYIGSKNSTGKSGYLLEIHAPKGTNTLDIEQTINNNGGRSMALHECEVLLERNTTYRVSDVIENNNGHYDTIVLDVVNPSAQTTETVQTAANNIPDVSKQLKGTLEETQIQGQLALTEVQTPQEELIANEPMQNLPAEAQIESQLSVNDYNSELADIASKYEKYSTEYKNEMYKLNQKYAEKIVDEHLEKLDSFYTNEEGKYEYYNLSGKLKTESLDEIITPYEGESYTLYHGTTPEAKANIMKNGFDANLASVHGNKDGIGGVYFLLKEDKGAYGNTIIEAKTSASLGQANTDDLNQLKNLGTNLFAINNFLCELGFDDETSAWGNELEQAVKLQYIQRKVRDMGYQGIVGTGTSTAAGGQYVSILDPNLIEIIS